MLRLSTKWSEFFRDEPETGMGYVVVTVILKDGCRYARAVVTGDIIGSINGNTVIPFTEDDIAGFEVTHDKTGLHR
jgi:hypothetical protein